MATLEDIEDAKSNRKEMREKHPLIEVPLGELIERMMFLISDAWPGEPSENLITRQDAIREIKSEINRRFPNGWPVERRPMFEPRF